MRKIVWIAGGVCAVTVVFLIPGQNGDIWSSVIWSSVTAFVYLLALSTVWLKKITSGTRKKVMAGTLALLILSASASLVFWSNLSEFTRENLPHIRTTIETGTARQMINQPLTRTLQASYRSNETNPDMENLFRSVNEFSVGENNQLELGGFGEDRTIHFYLAKAAADTITIVGESSYLKGMNSDFLNYSGKKGLFQVRGMLTNEGIDYERVN